MAELVGIERNQGNGPFVSRGIVRLETHNKELVC